MALFQGLRQGDGPNMEKAPLGDNLRPRYTLYLYICNIYNVYNIYYLQAAPQQPGSTDKHRGAGTEGGHHQTSVQQCSS